MRRLGKPKGVSRPAHTPDAYRCSKWSLAGSWPCSNWIQMTSEECGWRIPGAYPFCFEKRFGKPNGILSPAHTPDAYPCSTWNLAGSRLDPNDERGMWLAHTRRIPSFKGRLPHAARGGLRFSAYLSAYLDAHLFLHEQQRRIPLTHTLAPD